MGKVLSKHLCVKLIQDWMLTVDWVASLRNSGCCLDVINQRCPNLCLHHKITRRALEIPHSWASLFRGDILSGYLQSVNQACTLLNQMSSWKSEDKAKSLRNRIVKSYLRWVYPLKISTYTGRKASEMKNDKHALCRQMRGEGVGGGRGTFMVVQ